ncbi:MAG: type II toxin-antitoxin system prevent-host-death family antitoxin [Acidimicrobiales bacterium]|nr:type II toxin-antitoxin system prevent-host-death family antitoxin [Acidimicrobiales bacterium]MCB9394932.1 type II toxin-antitoxin system prevent-host-death family antitoxin [Acidimicrobiaceae bacterium]
MAIGIRELRADLAAHVRRAAAGEPTVVSVAGHPAAALVPLSAMSDDHAGGPQLSSLIAAGALVPPRRADGRVPDRHVTVWGNVRLDRLLREVRG